MYKIEKKPFGYHLTFGDFMKKEEMNSWLEESEEALKDSTKSFGVFVDMRTLVPLPHDSQKVMEEGQKMYKSKGMVRSVVILDNQITTLQFKRISKDSGIYLWERYIDASAVANWEEVGINWIVDSKDPDE